MKINGWIVGLLVLASGIALAESALSAGALRQRIEECARFEHAQDRREALDALKNGSGLSSDVWANMLFETATNRGDRFILNDVARYASTNQLQSLRAVFTNTTFNAAFRLAAFRVFSRVDGFGGRTVALIDEQAKKNETDDVISVRQLILQVRSLVSSNDVRRLSLEQDLRQKNEDLVR